MLVIRKGMKDDFSWSGYPITTSSIRISPAKNGMDISKDLEPKDSSPTKVVKSTALFSEGIRFTELTYVC